MLQNNFEYYQEITLIPSEEISCSFLMNRIFNKLHLIFVEHQNKGTINSGISFPKYNLDEFTLGDKIRVFFETKDQGEMLNLKKEFRSFDDYIHITNIREIPTPTGYAIFRRKHNSANKMRLAKRAAKRQNIDLSEMLVKYNDYNPKDNKLPFIKSFSSSTKQSYSICIEKVECEYKKGEFNTFGLSNNSPVPLF